MTALTREEFVQYWNQLKPGLGDQDSVLWSMEHYTGAKSQWFVEVRLSFNWDTVSYNNFWEWCDDHCTGQVMCYFSAGSDRRDWWGFTHHDDIVIWLLKWT